jgi:hypothetical protein
MSCQGNSSDINQTFIIEPLSITSSTVVSACTAIFTNELNSCSGDSQIQMASGATFFNTDILPVVDATIGLGLPGSRFRVVNSVSGVSTYWTATTSVTTAMLDLGVDSSGNTRQITANNSIIQDDILLGGTY